MEAVAEVPARLKATVNEPRVRVLCGLRIARFVERCRRYCRRRYPRIFDDRGSLASAILHPPSVGARNDPARLNCSRPHATVTAGLTIPRIVTYRTVHTRKCHPAGGVYPQSHH